MGMQLDEKDRHAYSPNDITATEIPEQLEQFCQECNIACNVTLPPLPPHPGSLFDDEL